MSDKKITWGKAYEDLRFKVYAEIKESAGHDSKFRYSAGIAFKEAERFFKLEVGKARAEGQREEKKRILGKILVEIDEQKDELGIHEAETVLINMEYFISKDLDYPPKKKDTKKKKRLCTSCKAIATRQTVKGKQNEKIGALSVNHGWYCDECWKKGEEEEKAAMYGE